MILPIGGIATCLNLLFILSYFGQILHTNLNDMSEMMYQSEWYRYPNSVQHFVMFMMMRGQRSFYISAYGMMHCNLENFVGVSDREARILGRNFPYNFSIFFFVFRITGAEINFIGIHGVEKL